MPSSAVCPERRRGWPGPDIRIRDGKIAAIGSLTLPEERQIDARDCVIHPAWVNTHHHLSVAAEGRAGAEPEPDGSG
ncbi:hypothetical protein J4730_06640 [Klebsiella pneumoniae]|uniref:Amidohydrolase n=1 Tax=Klebsiella pneumoniae TaxID=573 RepID=A0A939SQB5_KLEPN|nr:hypothetical protein [Klebsiella pneumoniae]